MWGVCFYFIYIISLILGKVRGKIYEYSLKLLFVDYNKILRMYIISIKKL